MTMPVVRRALLRLLPWFRAAAIAVVATLATAPLPAAAVEVDPPWLDAVDELGGALSLEVVEMRAWWSEWRDALDEMHDVNGPYSMPRPASAEPPPPVRSYGPDVERWRPLVGAFFLPSDVPWAMRVLACESHGDPAAKNPRSTASGLFQHLASLWSQRADAAGWPGTDVFDPAANVAVAAWLFYTDGPRHWVCT